MMANSQTPLDDLLPAVKNMLHYVNYFVTSPQLILISLNGAVFAELLQDKQGPLKINFGGS